MDDLTTTATSDQKNSAGFDINAIIEQQSKELGFVQPEKDLVQPVPQTGVEAPIDLVAKESALKDSMSGLTETSMIQINTAEQHSPVQGFNLGSLLSETPKSTVIPDLTTPTLDQKNSPTKMTSSKLFVFAKVLGIILLTTGFAYGSYFTAKIFYPIETERATNTISELITNLSANILGTTIESETTVSTDTSQIPETIDDNIETPIADSIQDNQGFIQGNGSIANTTQVQQNRDTVLPIDVNANTVLPETKLEVELPNTEDIDKSFDDLGEAFGMDTSTVNTYVEQLTKIQNDVKERESNYEINSNQRGLTITKTINTRVSKLIETLQSTTSPEAQTGIISTIEADIIQLNQLLEALNQL